MNSKTYYDSALKALSKARLIKYIRYLEGNLQVAEERIDNQYKILLEMEARCKNGSC